MISFITTAKLTDRSAVSACLLGSQLEVTSVFGGLLGGNEWLGDVRPTKAPAVAAAAEASACARSFAANGAGGGRQKTQHMMWAFRGHKPWRYPV